MSNAHRGDAAPPPDGSTADVLGPSWRGYVIAFVVVLAVALAVVHDHGAALFDLQVYRLGGDTLLHGGEIYRAQTSRGFLFTYPPFAAILFVPLAWLPFAVGSVVWTGVSSAALVALVAIYLPGLATTNARLVALALGAGCLEPIWQNFFLGQIDLILALTISVDLLWPTGRRGRGLLTGVAIGIKLTPVIFVPLLLLIGHHRAARNALAACAGTVAVALLVSPSETAQYWLHDIVATGRVGDQTFANNQSVLAVLQRLAGGANQHTFAQPIWLVLALLLGTAGIAVGRAWWRRGEPRLALAATATSALLASPVSWTHHWVWCLPMAAGLVTAIGRAGLPRAVGLGVAGAWTAAFVIAPNLWVPRHGGRELEWTGMQTFVGNTYVWLAIATLAYLAYLALRTPERSVRATGPSTLRSRPPDRSWRSPRRPSRRDRRSVPADRLRPWTAGAANVSAAFSRSAAVVESQGIPSSPGAT